MIVVVGRLVGGYLGIQKDLVMYRVPQTFQRHLKMIGLKVNKKKIRQFI